MSFCVALDISYGGVVEWLMAADCNSADESLRRFESCPLHHLIQEMFDFLLFFFKTQF